MSRARKLRKNATDAELRLWRELRHRRLGVRIRRQVPLGTYIVDFLCFSPKVIIEVDGGQHAESEADRVRDRYLEAEGFRVLRFWNTEVLGNLNGVLERIDGVFAELGAEGRR